MKFIKKFFKVILILFIVMFIIGVAIAGALGIKYYPKYKELKEKAVVTIQEIDDDTFRRLEPTQIVRKNGEIIREFTPRNYEYIQSQDIPQIVKQSFVSIEDKRFYSHDGVDYKAILRASIQLLKNKGKITQGGSTITQQLVKLTFLTNEQSYVRKINEIFISWELEKNVEKDKILEYYINNIYFGNGAYGFETAANHYFNKISKDLTLGEVAFLASIPNNPTVFDPINNKDNTHKRQRLILQNLLDDGVISETEFNEAVNQNIELNIKQNAEYKPENFEVSYVLHSTIELLMEQEGFALKYDLSDKERKVYQEEYNKLYLELNERVRQGGYKIVSTIDPVKQTALQLNINKSLQGFTATNDNLYQIQGAGVIINNITHEVEAVIGGRTAENQVNTFNRAALSYRQPGSIMKPIVAYGVEADIEMLGFTKYQDVKDPKGPGNSNHKYKGAITAREALERSLNTVPFELVKRRGPKLAHNYLHKMRFTKIVEADKNAGIAIGGLTYGVTPIEIAGAFSTLANNGEYVRPLGIQEIQYKDEVIFTNDKTGVQVYKSNSAYLITDMLKGVLEKEWGTGKKQKLEKMPAAGKTGTTDDSKDGWFAGYTPYYTTVIWVGNDTPKKVKGLYGGTYPGDIWKTTMEEIHKNLEVKDFEKPLGIQDVYVNSKGKVYDYDRKGTVKEILTAHLVDLTDVYDKNGVGTFQKREEEERLRRLEAERIRKEEEFITKYGVTLEYEENTMNTIRGEIKNITSISIKSQEDLEYVLTLLENLEPLLNDLYDEDNKMKIIKEIQDAGDNSYYKYDKYIERQERLLEEQRLEEIRKEEERIRKAKEPVEMIYDRENDIIYKKKKDKNTGNNVDTPIEEEESEAEDYSDFINNN